MASAPRPGSTSNANAQKDPAVTITVGGNPPLVMRFKDITARQASTLRKATGLSVQGIIAATEEDPDIDAIASMVWLARTQNGEDVTVEEVLDGFSYGTEVTIDNVDDADPEEEGEDGDPLLSSGAPSAATSPASPSTSA